MFLHEGTVMRSLMDYQITSLVDVAVGNTQSVFEIEEFRLIAEANAIAGTYSAWFSDVPFDITSAAAVASRSNQGLIPQAIITLGQEAPLEEFDLISVGWGVDTGTAFATVVLINPDEATAIRNAELLATRIRSGTRVSREGSWAGLVDKLEIGTSGRAVIARLIPHTDQALLGISHLDTGSMYRAITVHFIKNNYSLDNIDVPSVMDSIELEVSDSSDKESVFLNGEDVTDRLRSNEVSKLVSDISSVKEVRAKMVQIQRRISSNKSIVIDGRDIGTVVFPDAEFKFFITASIDSRAKRRFDELQESDSNVTLEQIEEEIKSRDHFDTTRENSPLKKAEDAITIDTTHLDVSEQVNMILEIINNNQENTNK